MGGRFRALVAIPVTLLLLGLGLAGCGAKEGNSYAGPAEAPRNPETVSLPGLEDQLVGTWVAATYKGKDGKTQQLDTNDPAQRLTYTFTDKALKIDWGGKGQDSAPYEWYLSDRDAKIQVIIVHFTKSGSGDSGEIDTSRSADVHYDVAFPEVDAKSRATRLRLTVTETGETTTLNRVT